MVFTIGECLLDIVFRNGQPEWSCPGGSMLNTAVSLGRFGQPVAFISETGNDRIGEMIHDFLSQNGVSTDHLVVYEGKSTLALAFLDDRGDAAYQFYHQLPTIAPEFRNPDFTSADLLMFGSFYSLSERNNANILSIVSRAVESGSIVLYDPNFRRPHLHALPETIEAIRRNISMADLVRASDEDMNLIAGAEDGKQAYEFIRECGGNLLVYTRNSEGVDLFTPWFAKHYHVPELAVVSTVGAGDSFNAGLASVFHRYGKISEDEIFWDEAIGRAIIFAAEVCGSRENFIGWQGTPPERI
ncbi:carbohydrate kinase [Lentimicrobium sp.]|uniref:carbohydrate kinase family protein n=1 Tax=Lentimicrobium sp. TaxID=2034841 RepID=UPI002BC850F9|nr:carbohydrate kinase [Lentimicrobium sp.]HPJ61301.1 carbohydrate kinase [Lentimicrobium sp.]